VASSSKPRRRGAHSTLSRLFALIVLLLSLLAQQRIARPAHLATMTTSASVSERSERVESSALLVEVALRVARAPFLARLPVALPSFTSFRAHAGRLLVRASSEERAQLSTHFHAKRRIPRMNSEEPPRRAS